MGAVNDRDRMVVEFTTQVVGLNPAHVEVSTHATLCDKVSQRLATGLWLSLGTPVSSTNKTDHHDITEILLKVVLNPISQLKFGYSSAMNFTGK